MMRTVTKKYPFFFKILSLVWVVRLPNILVLVLAQYLSCIFIFTETPPHYAVVWDYKLALLILSCALSVAGGYIINNFYDSEKDTINHPRLSRFHMLVSHGFQLRFYLILNATAVVLGFFVSWRTALFWACYIFMLWIYSHFVKRILFVGNIFLAALTIVPFFAVFFYLKTFYETILLHSAFLFLLILAKNVLKDLVTQRGDIICSYDTIPVVYGERAARKIVVGVTLAAVFFSLFLSYFERYTGMRWYFYLMDGVLPVFMVWVLWSGKTSSYHVLLNAYRFIIVLGVLFIALR